MPWLLARATRSAGLRTETSRGMALIKISTGVLSAQQTMALAILRAMKQEAWSACWEAMAVAVTTHLTAMVRAQLRPQVPQAAQLQQAATQQGSHCQEQQICWTAVGQWTARYRKCMWIAGLYGPCQNLQPRSKSFKLAWLCGSFTSP
jgi:hypothetical protein